MRPAGELEIAEELLAATIAGACLECGEPIEAGRLELGALTCATCGGRGR